MPTMDCSSHILTVTVQYDPTLTVPPPPVDAGVVAALLRQLAMHTDGDCAADQARDADISGAGMRLRFTDDIKRNAFKLRIPRYLHPSIVNALTVV